MGKIIIGWDGMAASSYVSCQVKYNTDLLIVERKNSNVSVRAALFETLALAEQQCYPKEEGVQGGKFASSIDYRHFCGWSTSVKFCFGVGATNFGNTMFMSELLRVTNLWGVYDRMLAAEFYDIIQNHS